MSDDLASTLLEQLSARGASTAHLAAIVAEPVDTVIEILHELVRQGKVVGGPEYWHAPGCS